MLEFVKTYPIVVAALLASVFGGTQWLIVYYIRGVRQDFKTVFSMLESHRDKIADNSKKTAIFDKCPLFGTPK